MKKSALISVYYKDGIVDFAKKLIELDWNIISTGGTYKLLKDNGIEVHEVSEVTNFPEMMDGRVKTLHPKIHGGILFRRDNESDLESIKKYEIESVDMVVNNLYPFEEMLKMDKDENAMIENIDIGGPSMIRAAAKNHKDVLIVVDPEDYNTVYQALKEDKADLELKKKLAAKAFSLTAYYDGIISNYFNNLLGVKFPKHLTRPLKLDSILRYGENPHLESAYYLDGYSKKENVFDFEQLHGKEISYNNMNDLTGCVQSLKEFDKPTVVAVKHTNPSGIGSDDDINIAFDKAYECDDISIFGGIVAVNRTLTEYIATKLNGIFIEIVIAPDYEEKALEILKSKKNIRILKSENLVSTEFRELGFKEVMNGFLVQDNDSELYREEDFKVVSKRKPSEKELSDMIFGIKACKNVNSNGVVLVNNEATVGYGFGEVRRSWAVEKAIERAKGKLQNSVLASDGFFFEDTIELLHENGIKAVISPGGSIHDEKVIELCDKYDITLVFTGMRHFKH